MDREQRELYLQGLLERPTRTTVTLLEEVETESQEAPIEGEIIHAEPIRKRLFFLTGRTPFLLSLIILGAIVFSMMSLIFVFVLPLFTETATVTIIPTQKHIHTQLFLQLDTIHTMQTQTFSLAKTVPTTGKRHQDATYAIGSITFYNAAPNTQVVPAGTLLIGASGVHILTNQDAVIPPGNAPIEGQVTIFAHAAMQGSGGNIAAYDLNGVCCRENVFVKNLSSFRGGQDARDFQIVVQSDIDRATSTLNTLLTPSIENSFAHELQPGEALITPLCLQKNLTDRHVGQEAEQVTVTLSETCTTAAYDTANFRHAARQAFTEWSGQTEGRGYKVVGELQTTITNMKFINGKAQLMIDCDGTLVYEFSQNEQKAIVNSVSGKSKEAALLLLLPMQGVGQVGVKVSPDGNALPYDSRRITILVMTGKA